jgi:hypothetical protein
MGGVRNVPKHISASEMTIHSAAEMSAHLLQPNLMLEQRSVINKSEPYHGGPIDQGGARSNPSTLPVASTSSSLSVLIRVFTRLNVSLN